MNLSPKGIDVTLPVDFVIITALEEEHTALLTKLPKPRRIPPTSDDIQTYYVVNLPVVFSNGAKGKYKLITLSLIGMGRVQAATATTDAIRRWKPRYVVVVGIAGGYKKNNVNLGDIIIADQIADYESQKITSSKFEIRWVVKPTDSRLLGSAKHIKLTDWQKSVKAIRPVKGNTKRHFGPVASGDAVVASSVLLDEFQKTWPKLLGVEMEAGGAAHAAFNAASRPSFFMVRGVSDLADENKGTSKVEQWRSYACEVAAAYVVALLRVGPVPLSNVTSTSPRKVLRTKKLLTTKHSTTGSNTTTLEIPLPKIRKTFSQQEKALFAEKSIVEIKKYFSKALKMLKSHENTITFECDLLEKCKLVYRVYVQGVMKGQCKVWQRASFNATSICYADGNINIANDNLYYDTLQVEDDGYELYLRPSGMWLSRTTEWKAKFTTTNAAEYLWQRFSETLSR